MRALSSDYFLKKLTALSLILVFVGVSNVLYAAEPVKSTRASQQPLNLVQTIKKRGVLNCGVNPSSMGFSSTDKNGQWQGIYVDFCRALAVGILGDAEKVKFFPLSSSQRFPSLQFGEIDILSWNSTQTLTREATLGIKFAPIIFYDGTQIMVPAKNRVKSVAKLKNPSICMESDSTTISAVKEYFYAQGMNFTPVIIEDISGQNNLTADAFFSGKCTAYAIDGTKLASDRAKYNFTEKQYVILPELLSKEPLSLAYRKTDAEFGTIVDWTIYALIAAEQYGVTKSNIAMLKPKTTNPEIRRLLGVEPGMGKALGIDDEWAYRAIKTVGNYGEIFDNNIGANSPLKLARGINKPFSRGGIMYAPPIR